MAKYTSLFRAAATVVALLLFTPLPVLAQHVCGAGAGPNEVMIGQAPGGQGMAPTPMCNWVQNSRPPPAPSRDMQSGPLLRLPPGWTASVVSGDDPDTLGTSQGMASRKEAIDSAMAVCKSKGGTQCKPIAAVKI